jgi:hypothetical protein
MNNKRVEKVPWRPQYILEQWNTFFIKIFKKKKKKNNQIKYLNKSRPEVENEIRIHDSQAIEDLLADSISLNFLLLF